MRQVLKLIGVLMTPLFFLGCKTIQEYPELDPKVLYKPDIKIKYGKYVGQGWMLLPDAASYSLEFEAPGKIDLIKITTCHRTVSSEDVKKGWLDSGRKYKWTYTPDPTIEKTRSCQVTVEAYEAGIPGRHSWGILEINAPRLMSVDDQVIEMTLPATVKCNGNKYSFKGVSVCIAEQGLKQKIKFDKPVRQFTDMEKCRIPEPPDKKNWTYTMANRDCAMIFCRVGMRQCHRHTTTGWEELAVRK